MLVNSPIQRNLCLMKPDTISFKIYKTIVSGGLLSDACKQSRYHGIIRNGGHGKNKVI